MSVHQVDGTVNKVSGSGADYVAEHYCIFGNHHEPDRGCGCPCSVCKGADIRPLTPEEEPVLPCGHPGLPTDNYCGYCGRLNDGGES